jgi:hypothetical protein
MKNLTILLLLLAFGLVDVQAQQEKGINGLENWLDRWTDFQSTKSRYLEPNEILAGNITKNTKLVKSNTYLLQGNVYVTNNAVLSIEPGTVILGDNETKGTLIITKGSKIYANGTPTDPIIFSSRKDVKRAGDWGGLVILGDAPINTYGGSTTLLYDLNPALTSYGGANDKDSSGGVRFVRIEFAGKKSAQGNLSGLTVAGVGSATDFRNVMVSYSAGNSFTFCGGEVSGTKLVSFKSVGDDFQFTQGVKASLTNPLAYRSAYLSSNKMVSQCLALYNYNKKEETDFKKNKTTVEISNMTCLNDSNNINADIASGLIKEAVYIGEFCSIDLKRTVISGFNPAVLIDSKTVIDGKSLSQIKLSEMYFNMCKGNIFSQNNPNNEDLENWYGNAAFKNYYAQADNSQTFISTSISNPDLRLQIGKITASNN